MHANLEQLLSLRDDDGVAGAEIAAHVAACEVCGARLAELRARRQSLRHLPELGLASAHWAALEGRLDATTPTARRGVGLRLAWVAALALGMAALLSVVLRDDARFTPPSAETVAATEFENASAEPELAAIIERSLRMEARLQQWERAAPAERGLAAAIATLEASLASVDRGLSQGAAAGLPAARAETLWQRRVDLMESLLIVRGAERAGRRVSMPPAMPQQLPDVFDL